MDQWREEESKLYVVENVVTAGISPSSRFSYWKDRILFLNCSVYSSYSRSAEPELCWVVVLFIRTSSNEVSKSGKKPLIFQPPPIHYEAGTHLCRRRDTKKAQTLLVITDFSLRVAEVPICHLHLSRKVSCLLAFTFTMSQRGCHTWGLPCTPTLPHRVELGCSKEFAKYQKGLHILQKDVEGISTVSSVLLVGHWGPRKKMNGSRKWLTARLVPCSGLGFYDLGCTLEKQLTVNRAHWERWACSGKETGWTSCQSFKPYSARERDIFPSVREERGKNSSSRKQQANTCKSSTRN